MVKKGGRLIVCGIDIGGSTASVVLLNGDDDDFEIVDTGITKLEINDSKSCQDVLSFYDAFNSFVRNHKVERIGIKERNPKAKGRHAPGPLTFKMEGLIQLCKDAQVLFLHPNTIAAYIRKNPPPKIKIYRYQSGAYEVAYTLLRNDNA